MEENGFIFCKEQKDFISLQIKEEVFLPIRLINDKPVFVLSKSKTTDAFDKANNSWMEQEIVSVPDPLGIYGETLIGLRRTERPKNNPPPKPSAIMEEETFKTLFPIFIHPENEWMLMALIEGMENPKILGWLYEQVDSLPDKTRAKKFRSQILLNSCLPNEIISKSCIFCNVTQSQVINSLDRHNSAIAINNDFPFGPVMHKVLMLQERKHDISEINAFEIESFYELLFEISVKARKQYGDFLDGVTYGMNYGLPKIIKGTQIIASGASQPHLHSQVAGITKFSNNSGDKIGNICRYYHTKYTRDYLADYLTALRNANLIVDEDDFTVLYVPIAQRFNYELQIMVKDPKIGNILETNSDIWKSIAKMEHLAYNIYQNEELSIQSFNTIMHSTRFSHKNTYLQRLIISIYPRTTILALSELANRNVVDSFPFASASKLIGIKKYVKQVGKKRLKVLIVSAHPDDIELSCSGLIIELRKRNHEVNAVIITNGCGGINRDSVVRENEANSAGKILGLKTITFGRIQDGQAYPTDTLYNMIESQIKRHNPDIVITHGRIETEHTDHKNISTSVSTVVSRYPRILPPIHFEVPVYKIDDLFVPNIYISIDEEIFKVKKEAINEHISEVKNGTIKMDLVEERMTQRAKEIGGNIEYSEAFYVKGKENVIRQLQELLPFISIKQG
jgi:N-acetylglucosamine malate deacetylase 1